MTPMVAPVAPVSPMPPTPSWRDQTPPALLIPPVPLSPAVLKGANHAVIEAPARVTSPYGERQDPFTGKRDFHAGIDIAAQQGSTIYAPAGGRVSFVGVRNGRGNGVDLETAEGVRIVFTHMDETKVKVGDAIVSGQLIGTVGSTGLSTGSHVHLEVWNKGQIQDPAKVKGLVLIAGH